MLIPSREDEAFAMGIRVCKEDAKIVIPVLLLLLGLTLTPLNKLVLLERSGRVLCPVLFPQAILLGAEGSYLCARSTLAVFQMPTL
jgi:hypothetical protein